MRKRITILVLIFCVHSLGNVHSQVSVFITPVLHAKMSINSDNSRYFSTMVHNSSPYYSYRTSNFTLRQPINYGLIFGVRLKNRHKLTFTMNSDGNTVFTTVEMNTIINSGYESYVANSIFDITKSGFNSYWLNYEYNFYTLSNKSRLSLLVGLGMTRRAGPNTWGLSLGSMGNTAIIAENGGYLNYISSSYTGYKRGWLVNLGVSSDIYINKKYWFSCSLLYSLSRAKLDIHVNTIEVNLPDQNYYNKWEHEFFPSCSGIYLSVSREIQLFPWIWKRKKMND